MVMDKKGQIGTMYILFIVIAVILVIGFVAVLLVATVDYASDTITPIITSIGSISADANVSQYAQYSVVPVNNSIQALPWIVAFAYIAALVFTIVFIAGYAYSSSPVLMGIYFLMMILLIFLSIFMSNSYQDIYTGNNEIALRLQEQTAMSYMILYSPFILAFITMAAGIYFFVNNNNGGDSVL